MKIPHPSQQAPFTSTGLLPRLAALALFAATGGSALAESVPLKNKKPIGTFVPPSGSVLAEVALKRLRAGNAHFVDGISTRANKQASRRAEVAEKQKPFAIIVSCSDSRVGPEVVFDQGLGDLFVVRTAGHVVDDAGLGSIEYAVEHLGASLILVLGHERCGAVAATVAGGKPQGHLPAIVKAIKPAVAKTKGQPGDAVENAVRAHVNEVAAQLKKAGPVLAERVAAGRLVVAGARYDLDTGRVEFLE
jgi:carbonic anhydrase